jgi:hypothetical protein
MDNMYCQTSSSHRSINMCCTLHTTEHGVGSVVLRLAVQDDTW